MTTPTHDIQWLREQADSANPTYLAMLDDMGKMGDLNSGYIASLLVAVKALLEEYDALREAIVEHRSEYPASILPHPRDAKLWSQIDGLEFRPGE